jgi:integrase
VSSVYKRPGRKTWTAFYRDLSGKQHCRSTGAHNKKLLSFLGPRALASITKSDLVAYGAHLAQDDLAKLRWSSIDLSKNELRFRAAKTGKLIVLPLAPPLQAHIAALPSSSDLQAPLHARAAAATDTCVLSIQFADLLAKVGLRPKRAHVKQERDGERRQFAELSFHSLRHSTVSLLAGGGLPQAVVQAYVGHSNAEMSALYTHVGHRCFDSGRSIFAKAFW